MESSPDFSRVRNVANYFGLNLTRTRKGKYLVRNAIRWPGYRRSFYTLQEAIDYLCEIVPPISLHLR